MIIVVGGWGGKIKTRREEVREGWKELHKGVS
jgi:hypothetical protein